MADITQSGTYYYTNAGTNTLTQVTANPTDIYQLSVSQTGGSVGYLQVYNNGSADAGAGTPNFVIPVYSGTAASGTPPNSIAPSRDVNYGAAGRRMDGGLSFLWAAGATGTVAHGVNAIVDITASKFV